MAFFLSRKKCLQKVVAANTQDSMGSHGICRTKFDLPHFLVKQHTVQRVLDFLVWVCHYLDTVILKYLVSKHNKHCIERRNLDFLLVFLAAYACYEKM